MHKRNDTSREILREKKGREIIHTRKNRREETRDGKKKTSINEKVGQTQN